METVGSNHRRIGVIAAFALVAGSLCFITMPNDPAKATGSSFTGDPVYAIVGELSGCDGPRGMTVVRNGTGDDTVYVACSDDDSVAYISDDSVMGSVSGTIGVGVRPVWVETPDDDTTSALDDTVYVGYLRNDDDYVFDSIGVIPAGVVSGTEDDSIRFGDYGFSAAVSSDDTVYIAYDDTRTNLGDDTIGVLNPGFDGSGSLSSGFEVPTTWGLVAFDDTLFSWGYPDGLFAGVGAIGMASETLDDSLILAEGSWLPIPMAVSDDTLFVPTFDGDDSTVGYIWAVNPRTLTVDDSIDSFFAATGVATNPEGLFVFTRGSFAGVVDGSTMEGVGVILSVGKDFDGSQAMTRSGVAYVGDTGGESIYRLAEVTPQLDVTDGAVGTTVQLTLTPSAPNVTVDDSTVTRLEFGGATAVLGSSMTRVGNTFTFTAPNACGVVNLNLTLNGFIGISMGTWTYPACPDPTPPAPIPPGAPTSVEAIAVSSPGIELPSASVSWVAPASSGSFPITQYQVTGSPSGSCLVSVPATSCEVPGLEYDTEYTFTVRALSGAGWGAYSQPSNAISPVRPDPPPVPTIVISGTRGDVRGKPGVIVSGQTSGFAEGTSLVPWLRFPGQTAYQAGNARPQTDASGEFTWERRTNKKIYVSVRSFDESIRSNRVVIPAAKTRHDSARAIEPTRVPSLRLPVPFVIDSPISMPSSSRG